MKNNQLFFILFILITVIISSCREEIVRPSSPLSPRNNNSTTEGGLVEGVDYFLPKIDLSHWKVTLPIGNPTEIKPPEILDYATNEVLKPFMYNDSTDGSLVFYTYPGAKTTNTSYSRTELREQMIPGDNNTNWTFAEGGRMKGTLKLEDISTDTEGKTHRVVVMQIHGRLTDDQKNAIGASDNNAPPILKVYWAFDRVRVIRKVLKDTTVTGNDILPVDAWSHEGFYFSEYVYNNSFTLEIIASDGRLEIILNDNESMVFDDIHIQKWSVFENYFKAGNYLASTEDSSFAKIKYYDLEVSH